MTDANNSDTPKYWFRAKSSGFGWGMPLSWQGWLLYGWVFGIAGGGYFYFEHPEEDVLHGVLIVVSVLVLVVAAILKGEPLKRQ